MARRARLGASLLLVVVFVLALAQAVRADGDPASDILYTQRLFVPFDTNMSKGAQEMLTTAIAEAEHAGYPVRVAVIEKPADLGAVTVLWGKPKQYARFLSLELGVAYKGQLLIVMPSGLGFAYVTVTYTQERTYKRTTADEYRTLAAVPVQPGADGLALTATRAIERLARRAGHPIAAPAEPPQHGSSSLSHLLLVGGAVLGVALLAVCGFAIVRRRPART